MNEKVNVSQYVANAIESFKTMQKEKFNITDIDELLNIATDWWLREEFHEFADLFVVHELKFIDFCNAFYHGYNIVKTPEDIIRERFDKFDDYSPEEREHKFTICFVLDTLGIKIKGVNE